MILSLIRHAITGCGAILVTKGFTNEAGLEQISGAVSILIGIGLSYFDKKARA